MRIITVRNVHEALPVALKVLSEIGVRRESRNGPVLYGGSVTTVYRNPLERVMFWSERDANPFFHLYESLWMLAGRNDVAPLERYVKNSINYSDDGKTLHGAYGHRWRVHFNFDQLQQIAETLRRDADSRRCVLQMWDCRIDGSAGGGKDYPCNTMATFQRGIAGELNLTVFCRSNDIVWGAYGANAVQFGALLEYMAVWIGCPVGIYEQISVNWHGYIETLHKVQNIKADPLGYIDDPYPRGDVHVVPMTRSIDTLDREIRLLLHDADTGFQSRFVPERGANPWAHMVYTVLKAHHLFKTGTDDVEKYGLSMNELAKTDQKADWVVAASEWIYRRYNTHLRSRNLGVQIANP